jgi:hypothetical protein
MNTLFTHRDKKYNIVIATEHRDFKYYYCWEIIHIDSMVIQLVGAKELVNYDWVPCNDIQLNISKIIKVLYILRL